MVQYEAAVFNALADPARCAIVARLAEGECSVAELAEPFAMTLQGVRKHLAVLEDAGVVRTAREGRVRKCRLAPEKLKRAAAWLERRADIWNGRLDRMGAIFREEKQ